MPYKIVLTYVLAAQPWREVFYSNDSVLAEAASVSQATVNAALAMRNQLVVLKSIRVSDVTNLRNTVLKVLNAPAKESGLQPDITSTAAVVNLSTGNGWQRKIWLRGLNDNDVQRDALTGADEPTASLRGRINNYIRAMNNEGWCIRGRTKVGVGGITFVNITNVQATANTGLATLTVASITAGLAVGSQVYISRLNPKLYPGLTGVFNVTATAAGPPATITVQWNSDTTVNAPTTKGTYRLVTYTYQVILAPPASSFAYFSEHRTAGDPLGGRGARRGNRGLRLA